MSAFGENLKKERETRGISLQEISDHTRIGVRQLKAIEEEHLELLPGGIFNKSFVRQYARYLGLDEERIVSEYQETLGSPVEKQSGSAPPIFQTLSHPHSKTPVQGLLDGNSRPRKSGYLRLLVTAVCVGIAVAAIFYGLHKLTDEPPPIIPSGRSNSLGSSTSNEVATESPTADAGLGNPDQPAQEVPSISSPLEDAAAPVAVQSQDTPQASEPGASNVVLRIDARREVWLSIAADGRKPWQGTLNAGHSQRVEARNTIQLVVGDSGAVDLTVNGKSLPPVGRSGEVKNLTISARGLEEPAR